MKKSLSFLLAIGIVTLFLSSELTLNNSNIYESKNEIHLSDQIIIILPPIIPNKNKSDKKQKALYNEKIASDIVIITPPLKTKKEATKVIKPTKRRAFETEYVQA